MGNYKFPPRVKLIVGLLYSQTEIFERVRKTLHDKFGSEEVVMEPIPFVWTQYYQKEVGSAPWRAFVSYENLIPRESLVEVKRYTNELEMAFSQDGLRPINIDPGYLTLGQFFLATTKDQRQRVYIREGIYVEPTLFYQDSKYRPFEWTYPDYRSEDYGNYFEAVRVKLAFQLRQDTKKE